MSKKITSQRELEQFMRDLFQENGKEISWILKKDCGRYYRVFVDKQIVSEVHVDQFKAYNDALRAASIEGVLTYKWNAKKDIPEWTYKETAHA